MLRSMILVAAGSVIALSGCGEGAGKRVLELTAADSNKHIVAAVGQSLRLSLKTIGMGNYEAPSISSPAVKFVRETVPDVVLPGGANQLFEFLAVAAGSARIVLQHTLIPGEPRKPDFVLTVDVN